MKKELENQRIIARRKQSKTEKTFHEVQEKKWKIGGKR